MIRKSINWLRDRPLETWEDVNCSNCKIEAFRPGVAAINLGDETMNTQVVTWITEKGAAIDVTQEQEAAMIAAAVWPEVDGHQACRVSEGLHCGQPTFTDTEIIAFCNGSPLPGDNVSAPQ